MSGKLTKEAEELIEQHVRRELGVWNEVLPEKARYLVLSEARASVRAEIKNWVLRASAVVGVVSLTSLATTFFYVFFVLPDKAAAQAEQHVLTKTEIILGEVTRRAADAIHAIGEAKGVNNGLVRDAEELSRQNEKLQKMHNSLTNNLRMYEDTLKKIAEEVPLGGDVELLTEAVNLSHKLIEDMEQYNNFQERVSNLEGQHGELEDRVDRMRGNQGELRTWLSEVYRKKGKLPDGLDTRGGDGRSVQETFDVRGGVWRQ